MQNPSRLRHRSQLASRGSRPTSISELIRNGRHWCGEQVQRVADAESTREKTFKSKYFPESTELWSSRGLSACQTLAREMHEGTARFRYLDAPQLLKHALGLATQHPGNFELYYAISIGPDPNHRASIRNRAVRKPCSSRLPLSREHLPGVVHQAGSRNWDRTCLVHSVPP